MAGFVKGEVVVVPFPFSNLTRAKRRPALVIATISGDEIIFCQITSQKVKDNYAIGVSSEDFQSGDLHKSGNIRPNRIFTADKELILYSVGILNEQKISEVTDKIIYILRA